MPVIGFRVTRNVVNHLRNVPNPEEQQQIAVDTRLGGAATQGVRRIVRFADGKSGSLELAAGDTYAIFRQHDGVLQPNVDLFDRLYHLLNLFPGVYLKIECEIE